MKDDVTSLKKTEEALREKETMLRLIGNNLSEVMIYQVIRQKDGTRKFTYVSEAVKYFYGCSPEEALADPARIYGKVADEDKARIFNEEEAAFRSFTVFSSEVRIISPSGRMRWSYFRSSPRMLEDGSSCWDGVEIDITERKKAEVMLQRSEKEKELILTNIPDLVVYQDTENKIIWANDSTARAFGKTVEQLIGSVCYKIFHKKDQPCAGCPVVKAIASKQSEEAEMTSPDGRIWIIRGIPIKDDRGNILGILEVAIDITERKKAEAVLKRDKEYLEKVVRQKIGELTKTQKELEDSKRLADIGTLGATIAHELRNPLGVIKTAVYNVRRKSEDAGLAGHLDVIDKKISESDMIIRNLLSYSRIKMPNYENVPVIKMLEACVADAKSKHVDYNINMDTKINCKEDFIIEADMIQLTELISNILDNAYLAYPDKKGNVDIEIDCNEKQNKLNMVFRDYGDGVDDETLSKIYDPFFTTRARGIGLGMTVCSQVISLHKGAIEVKSKKGAGTTIFVSLPIKRR